MAERLLLNSCETCRIIFRHVDRSKVGTSFEGKVSNCRDAARQHNRSNLIYVIVPRCFWIIRPIVHCTATGNGQHTGARIKLPQEVVTLCATFTTGVRSRLSVSCLSIQKDTVVSNKSFLCVCECIICSTSRINSILALVVISYLIRDIIDQSNDSICYFLVGRLALFRNKI